jgi:hypothetical protein
MYISPHNNFSTPQLIDMKLGEFIATSDAISKFIIQNRQTPQARDFASRNDRDVY